MGRICCFKSLLVSTLTLPKRQLLLKKMGVSFLIALWGRDWNASCCILICTAPNLQQVTDFFCRILACKSHQPSAQQEASFFLYFLALVSTLYKQSGSQSFELVYLLGLQACFCKCLACPFSQVYPSLLR